MIHDEFRASREIHPSTEEVEFKLRYTATIGARVTLEKLIQDGDSLIQLLMTDLEAELRRNIIRNLKGNKEYAPLADPMGRTTHE